MSRKKLITTLLPAIAICVTSCSTDDNPTITGSGNVNLCLNVDSEILAGTTTQNRSINAVPQPEDFAITMTGKDGGYAQSWESLSLFPQDETVKIGAYTMEAHYGDINDEGFEKPYYYGSTDFMVSEAATSDVEVICALANTMVSISYTDAFKGFFSDFSTELHSEGGTYITYGKEETRPVYLKPGKVSMSISLTKQNGVSTTFQPADIANALPKHHYRITLDVNGGNMGEGQLVIKFDDSVTTENITIDLSDELMSSPAPEITTEGFNNGETINITEGIAPSNEVKAIVNARGGLSEVTLTTQSQSLLEMGFPAEIELMSATTHQQELLSQLGLSVSGLWNNPDKMALINFTQLLSHIKANGNVNDESIFVIVAKDKYSKVNEPVYLKVSTTPVEISTTNATHSIIGDNRATITLSSTSTLDKGQIKIEASDDNGTWHNADIESLKKNDDNTLSLGFTLPQGVCNSNVRIYYNNSLKSTATITRISPNFSIEVDAFANKAAIKVIAENEEMTEIITRKLSIFANGIEPAILNRDTSQGIISVSGLNSATTYQFKATMMKGNPSPSYSNIVKATTESISNVPDGNFESGKEQINSILLSGGKYSQTHLAIYNQQNKTHFKIFAPKENWATVNAKTFCETASNQNTWYMQPSAMMVDDAKNGIKAMKLTSVAWDTNGENIADFAQEQGSIFVEYNKNIPSISHRAAGKLFLGKYTFNPNTQTETYEEGVKFTSRPSALNGYFKYTPSASQLSDKGIVIVSIVNKNGNKETEIAHGELLFSGNSDYTSFSVPLTYNDFAIKATHLKIMFASSKNIGSITYETENVSTTPYPQTASSTGSELWIDNLTFSY